ncbi:hypothetical protein BBK82_10665 [Lentzea guizhouensis]|uniref:MarR family transcriptional regulator n=1 Tax=Lentzea guizhouensis TaxID=1586287 RepID=A0A1B2HFF9_9PSEU|nr:hypothetical protein [Lentzea guizhouensis]ANZ36459.1 hypothetical protein BBK82_10665 [Lentzea guizhouensis]
MVRKPTAAERAAAVAALEKEQAIYRVAYLIARGDGRPAELMLMSSMDSVMQAMSRGWVAAPITAGLPYQLTDSGRVALTRWFRIVADHAGVDPACKALYEAVTAW